MKKYIVFAVFTVFATIVNAQTSVTYSGLDHINRIIGRTPGITSVSAISSGAVVTAAGDVLVKPSGLKIPVSIAANVSKAKIVAAALGCTGGGVIGVVGCAATAAAIAYEINKNVCIGASGYPHVCNAALTPGTVQQMWVLGSSGNQSTSGAACTANNDKQQATNPDWVMTVDTMPTEANGQLCTRKQVSPAPYYQISYVSATVVPRMGCLSGEICDGSTPEPTVVPDSEIELSLQDKMDADYQANQRMLNAIRQDIAQSEASGQPLASSRNPVDSATPVVVTAAIVVSPSVETNVKTISNADGSTSTERTNQQTTFTPTSTGTTVGDSKITFPSATTTTVTNIHNETNATSVTTNVTNNAAPVPEAVPLELPDDYNREATQKQIADELSAKNAPAAPVDQEARTQTALAETDTGLADIFTSFPNQFVSDKEKWFSWVWTPPAGVCNPSEYSGTVHGFGVSWNICPTVDKIRSVLGWLFALFGAFIVYGQIFKGSKS